MKQIDRKQAIELINSYEISNMSVEEKEIILLDWWSIDESDKEFLALSASLRKEILETDSPADVESQEYIPLLAIALQYKFKGVKNDYIRQYLKKINHKEYELVGKPENLFKCPCCNYLTLELKSEYDICSVCYWEDDGSSDLEKYSPVNRLTLQEAKGNFLKYGAVTRKAVEFVDPEGKKKWIKHG